MQLLRYDLVSRLRGWNGHPIGDSRSGARRDDHGQTSASVFDSCDRLLGVGVLGALDPSLGKAFDELSTHAAGEVADEAVRRQQFDVHQYRVDRHFSLGSHLNARDRKAVRRTVSGLVKNIHPNGEPSEDDLAELLELAIEGRGRVKEQLKKMGAFEYYQTLFSYTLEATGEERSFGVPPRTSPASRTT